jgi:pimeloyl-ACP methyl ester carboxylesterase
MYKKDVKHHNTTVVDGVRIAYQVSGQGPALVCCHAMANDHRMYDLHRDSFSESHTVVTFDQRGSGDSDHPHFEEGSNSLYTVEKFGDDLKAVLDDLGIKQASIVGFSMGAVAALSFCTRWPDRVERLVLASAMASRLPQPIIDRARLVEQVLDKSGLDEAYDFYFSGMLFDGLLESRGFHETIALFREKATPQGFKGCFRVTIDRPSLIDALSVIQCPTLILVGETDTHYLPEAELLERTISNAKKVVMTGVGHAMCVQDAEAFEAEIMAFVS